MPASHLRVFSAVGDLIHRSDEPAIELTEAILLGGTVALALLSWMALLAMNLGVGHLPVILLLTAAALVIVGLVVRLTLRRRPWKLVVAPASLAVTGVVAIVMAIMALPGFRYGVADKDPGAYIAIGAAFAHYGSTTFPDVLAAKVPGISYASPGARFPAVWVGTQPNTIHPQFYHLWPSLLAVAHQIAGLSAEFEVAPLLAVIGAMIFTALLRRVITGTAGRWASLAGGLLLALNMLDVWQAKYPTAEMFSQVMLLGALLALIVALDTGIPLLAAASGLFIGVDWLARADIVLIVALSVAVAGALIALRRFTTTAGYFCAGLAIVVPHALWQAYVGARKYSFSNGVPTLSKLLAGVILTLVVAFAVRRFLPRLARRVDALLTSQGSQQWLGLAALTVLGVLTVAGFLRPLYQRTYTLFGPHRVPTYNEETLRHFSWFVTLPMFIAVFIGLAVVLLGKWRPVLILTALPLMLFGPIYGYNLANVLPLMPGVRRLIPEILPGFLAMGVLGLVAVAAIRFGRRPLLRIPATIAVIAVGAIYAGQSLPLRHHDEMGGSVPVSARMAALPGSHTGVFLFQWSPGMCCTQPEYLFGSVMWLERGQLSALLPPDPSKAITVVHETTAAFPADPVYIIWQGTEPPPGLDSLQPRSVDHIVENLQQWQQSYTYRPSSEGPPIGLNFTVWQVAGPS